MIFETGAYFATLNQETFYPKVEVRWIPIKFRRNVVADPDLSLRRSYSITPNRKSIIIFRCF
jgi:hypothetical protein